MSFPLIGGGKKKKNSSTKQDVNVPKVKRHTETMASVMQESVVETILSEFKENSRFCVQSDNNTFYVGLYFDTERIGGLSKKSSKDEAKGQLIESINSGYISSLITSELMSVESIVFIPNQRTLTAMNEYELLRNLNFPLCYISTSGDDVEVTDVNVTIKDCMDILDNIVDIESILMDMKPGVATEEALIEAEDESQGTFVDSEANDDDDFEDEEADNSNKEEEFEDAGAGFSEQGSRGTYENSFSNMTDVDSEPEPESLPFDDNDSAVRDNVKGYADDMGVEFNDDFSYNDNNYDDDENWDDGQEEEEDRVEYIQDDAYEQVLKRRLYSDDLGLEISTEPFDAEIMHQNKFIDFSTDRKGGWLDEQLNNMSREANTELKRIHRDNLIKCRSQYFNLISLFCRDLVNKLDYTDKNTKFGQMYFNILEEYNSDLDKLNEKIAERKRLLNDEFDKNVKSAANAAAEQAAQEYRERHNRQHTDRLYRIESDCKEEIEDDRSKAFRQLHDMRREEAAKAIDIAIHESMIEVSKMYQELLKEEAVLYKNHLDKMSKFLEDNRDKEMARVDVLRRDLQESDRANAVMAEYSAKMEALRAEFNSKKEMMESQLKTLERRHQEEILIQKQNYQREITQMNDRLVSADEESSKLRDQIVHMDEVKDKQYEGRIQELAGEREAFSRKYEHLADMQKKQGAVILVASVVGVIAALAVGFAAGMFATGGANDKIQNIQLPPGYVLIEKEDGTSAVVPEGSDVVNITDEDETKIPGSDNVEAESDSSSK